MFGNALYFPFLALFLVNQLHVSYVEIGIIITGVGLIQLPTTLLGGALADRVERLRLIIFGLVAEVATTAGLAYAFSIDSLVLAITAAAIGGSLTSLAGPSYSAYIADFAVGAERTRGFTFFRIGFNAGYSAGVTLGGLLVSDLGFAGAVAVAVGIVAVGAAFLSVTLEPSPRDLARRTQPLPSESAPAPTRSRSMRESFGLLRRDRVALELLVAFFLASLVAGQWGVTFPLFVHNVLGISYSLLGIGLALNGLVVVFGQTVTTESVIGQRHTSIAIWGLGLYVVSFLALGLAGALGTLPVIAFFVGVVVLTVGENLLTIPQATLPSNVAPKEEIGAYNGAFSMMAGIGFVLSVLVGGVVLSLTANPVLIWLLLVAPAVPAVLLLRHASRRISPDVDRA
jgi:predicted MFS family arabinose efflux permease